MKTMGELEFDKCEICGKETIVERTYFFYPIHCECCGRKDENGQDQHFVRIKHCTKCVPTIPEKFTVRVRDYKGNISLATVKRMKPTRINGNYKEK